MPYPLAPSRMRQRPTDRYSPALCRGVQATLRSMAAADLAAMLPGLQQRGGQGLVLLRLELRRRHLPYF